MLAAEKKQLNERIEKLYAKLINMAWFSLFYLGLGVYYIDNYVHWILFILYLVLAGIVLGSIVYAIIIHRIPAVKTFKDDKGNGMHVVIFFISIVFCFGTGTFINDLYPIKKQCGTYHIERLGSSSGKNDAFYVTIYDGKKDVRLSFGKQFNKKHSEGQSIELCLVTGVLGFTYYTLPSDW